jgi:hypothetical protein
LGTYGPDPPLIEHVDEALFQGILRSHINEIDSFFRAEVGHLAEVGEFHKLDEASLAFGSVGYPGISRCEIDLIYMLTVRISVSQAVIPAAGTVYQYIHDAPSKRFF